MNTSATHETLNYTLLAFSMVRLSISIMSDRGEYEDEDFLRDTKMLDELNRLRRCSSSKKYFHVLLIRVEKSVSFRRKLRRATTRFIVDSISITADTACRCAFNLEPRN